MSHKVEVVAVQAERHAYLLDLIDESLDLPQVGVIRLVAVRGAQMVVVEVLNACRREIAVASLPVLVGRGWPAVQEQHLGLRVVADTLGPDLKVAFGSPDRDHLDAAAESVVAAGVVEVPRFSFYQAEPPSLASVGATIARLNYRTSAVAPQPNRRHAMSLP